MITHPALEIAFTKRGRDCATISDYATASGLRAEQVLSELEPLLDSEQLMLEFVGSEVFVHTAPQGRDATATVVFPPNLWEMLRERADQQTSYVLWRLSRQLTLHGWRVEAQTSRIRSGLGVLDNVAHLGLTLGQAVVPVLVFPAPDALSAPHGLLGEYATAGAATVAVVCDAGALDAIVAAAREWNVRRSGAGVRGINVLILEAPTFSPVLLGPHDTSVQPVSLAALNHPDAWRGHPAGPNADTPTAPR